MSNKFTHGYALLIGVGESAYNKLSLPVTVTPAGFVEASPSKGLIEELKKGKGRIVFTSSEGT
ncbi:hypothetical protein [Calothrix sp. PCC 7507]|uniref:hypothetical protein n=1 Tax=Calothrix sp. PCC 7507 TaxID=99598 RepID=UPI00031EE771|nr:hypothetical protein [Calothrix sp. PCC 7507]